MRFGCIPGHPARIRDQATPSSAAVLAGPRRPGAALLGTGLALGLAAGLAGCSGTSADDRMAQARSAIQAHDYQRAEVQLKTVLQSHADNAQAWLLLGQTSMARRQFDDAVHQFQRARKAGAPASGWQLPLAQAQIASGQSEQALATLADVSADASTDHQATAYALRGTALAATDQPDQAGKAFDAALAKRPDLGMALRGRAGVEQSRGDIDAARKDLHKALKADAQDRQAAAQLGQLEYTQQRCDTAEPILNQALGQGANALPTARATRIRSLLADCQLRTGDTSAAKQNVAKVLSTDANDPYGNYLQALINIDQSDFQQAANHIQATLNADPDNLPGMTLMAWIRIAQGHDDMARPYLARVLARAPDDITALRMQAGLMVENDQQQQALELVRQAYERNPDAPGLRQSLAAITAWLDTHGKNQKNTASADAGNSQDVALQIDLARSLAGLDSTAAALTVLDKVKPDGPDTVRALARARIQILQAAGRNDQALDVAKHLADQDSGLESRLLLADTYASAGDFDQARQVIDPLAKSHGDDPRIATASALLAVHRGDPKSAIAALEPVAKARPDDADIHARIAALQMQTGQVDQAIAGLKSFVSGHPDDQTSAQTLARLYLAAGRNDQAGALIQSHLADQPGSTDWQLLKGQTQLAGGQTDAGLKTLSAAAKASDGPGPALVLARAQLAQGDNDGAAATLAAVAKKQPNNPQAASLLALVEARRGHTDAAMAQVKILRQAGQGYAADLVTGDVQRAAGHAEAADTAYGRAYDQRASASVAIARFDTRRAGGLSDPAAPLIDWNRQAPGDPDVALRLGGWYQSHGHDAEAVKVYRALLDARPDNVVALNNLAVISASSDSAKAIDYAQQAHRLAPKSAAVADTLGWLEWQHGDRDTGRGLIRSAYEQAGSASAEIAFHYGVAFAHQENAGDSARQALQKALDDGGLTDDQKTRARALLSDAGNRDREADDAS